MRNLINLTNPNAPATPDDEAALWVEAKAWLKLPPPRDSESGLRIFGAILRHTPDNFQAVIAYSNCMLREGRAEGALPVVSRARVINPQHPQGYLIAAKCHFKLKQPSEAIAVIEQMLAAGSIDNSF